MATSKELSSVGLSIGVASNHVAKSDVAYHNQLARIEAMTRSGQDTAVAKRIGRVLQGALARNHAWLRFLQNMQQ